MAAGNLDPSIARSSAIVISIKQQNKFLNSTRKDFNSLRNVNNDKWYQK